MVCQVCGTKNPEGSKFCEGCGVELKTAPAETAAATTTAAATPVTPANETPPAVSSEAAAVVAAAVVAAAAPVSAVVNESASSAAASSVPEASPTAASSEIKSTAEAPADSSPDIAVVAAPAEVPTKPAETKTTPPAATSATPADASATPAPSAPAATHSGPQLVARQFGSTTDFVFPLAGQKLSVGRFDPSTGPVDLDLSNLPGKEHVSRRHGELFFENGKWMVRDLGSTNGVYVKKSAESQFGARIQAPVALEDGDEVAFGNVQFVYQAD